jgi:hypothetical protein
MAINSVTASPAVQQAMVSDNIDRPGQPDRSPDRDDKTVAAPAVTQTTPVPTGSTFSVYG